jgi:hypothetical protein
MSQTRALLKAVDAWVQAYETPAQIAFAETDILEQEDVALSKAEFAGSPLHLKSTKLILTKGKPNYNPKERMEMLTEIDRPLVLQCNRLVCQICGLRCILDLDDRRQDGYRPDNTNLANLAASFWNSLSSSSKTRDDIVNRQRDDRLKRQHTTSLLEVSNHL